MACFEKPASSVSVCVAPVCSLYFSMGLSSVQRGVKHGGIHGHLASSVCKCVSLCVAKLRTEQHAGVLNCKCVQGSQCRLECIWADSGTLAVSGLSRMLYCPATCLKSPGQRCHLRTEFKKSKNQGQMCLFRWSHVLQLGLVRIDSHALHCLHEHIADLVFDLNDLPRPWLTSSCLFSIAVCAETGDSRLPSCSLHL